MIHRLLVLFLAFTVVAAAEEIDLSNGHYPMIYVSTSGTEAHFNVLVPRNKSFAVRATPVKGPRGAKSIDGTLIGGPFKDQQGLLHDHILKFKITGLKPATEYKFELVETSSHGSATVDERNFSTFDDSPKELKFVAGSCMSDEMRYEEVRQKIITNILKQQPDVVVLLGDQVYVDSFDYVQRHKATEYDIWARNFNSFKVNPLFRSKRLLPTIVTWDDHDTGVDNGNKFTETIADARRAFQAIYGASDISGVSENGTDGGVERIVSIRGQNFILLDNRSFRGEHDATDRYGHLGQKQEEWLIQQLRTKKGFFWLVDGGMWGGETILQKQHDGTEKRLTEGFYGDHPTQYEAVMKALHDSGVPYGLISGDIHFTQFIEHAPEHAGTPRFAPFKTLEIVSSAMFSIIFPPAPGEPVLWHDPQRITGVKDYNFVVVDAETIPNGVDMNAASIGVGEKPFFEFGTRIQTTTDYVSNRRQLLVDKSSLKAENGKVKVAFFDADSTLRIAKSGGLSANDPTDVVLLPGVSERIAELVKDGYLIAIVSNQNGVSEEHVSFKDNGKGDSSYEGKFKIADHALRYTVDLIQKGAPGAVVHYYDFAESSKNDFYHKPNIGMGKHLERVLAKEGIAIDWQNSFMVGDSQYTTEQIGPDGRLGDAFSDADRRFAENLGIRNVHPQQLFGWSGKIRAAIVHHNPKELAMRLCEEGLTVEQKK